MELPVLSGAGAMLAFMALSFAVSIGTSAVPAALTGASDYFASAVNSVVSSVIALLVVLVALPVYGAAALGAAQLLATLGARGYLILRLRRRLAWFGLRPVRLVWSAAQVIGRSSIPLLVVGASGQVISWAAMVVVGISGGAPSAAILRVAMLVPAQSTALLYRAYDVIFPRLSAADACAQIRATVILTRAFSALAGVMAATLIVLRADVTRLLIGQDSTEAQRLLVSFTIMWVMNVPAHGVALLAIVRGRQRALTPIVTSEAIMNILLTIVLVDHFGIQGAGWAAVLSLGLFNLVVLPVVLHRHMEGVFRIVGGGLLSLLVCAGVSLLVLFEFSTRMQGHGRLLGIVGMSPLLGLLAVATGVGAKGRAAMRAGLRKGGDKFVP